MDIPVSDIYFEYDSHAVQPEDLAKIKEVSEWLKANSGTRIVVEGHCDERGTVEYNLALGQKRADVVKSHLIKLGVDEKKFERYPSAKRCRQILAIRKMPG